MGVHRKQLAVGGLFIACAFAYLGMAAAESGWVYSVDVDSLAAASVGRRARVHGTVGLERFEVRPADRSATFELVGSDHGVRVRYAGVIPPLLRPGGQVVIEGALDAEGVFVADTLLTKCASRYEPKTDGL